MALKLQVLICSTRPGRMGGSVGHWFANYARAHSDFDVLEVDLAELDLPMYNEPKHPIMQQYEHEDTKEWGARDESADADVFVTPEYNHSTTHALVNALNYVYHEWNYNPCGFVSYGGVSGGLRAAQAARLQVTTLKMMPIPEGVAIPGVGPMVDRDTGVFTANEAIERSAQTMLGELQVWARGLKALRDTRD